MKRFSYGILALMLTVLSFACQTEEIAPQSEIANQKNVLPLTFCNINGETFELEPNKSYTFTHLDNLSDETVQWSVTGNVSITSGQGTAQVTIFTHFDYAGGTISAEVSGKDTNGITQTCSSTEILTTSVSPTCDPSVTIAQDFSYGGGCQGDEFRFTASATGSPNGGTYSWSVSSGASIVAGQGTSAIRVQSPSNDGFTVSVTYDPNCQSASVSRFTIAQFSSSCN